MDVDLPDMNELDAVRRLKSNPKTSSIAGKKEAKAALDTAVKRGNELLRQFERASR